VLQLTGERDGATGRPCSWGSHKISHMQLVVSELRVLGYAACSACRPEPYMLLIVLLQVTCRSELMWQGQAVMLPASCHGRSDYNVQKCSYLSTCCCR
jgi:hypothetical protein